MLYRIEISPKNGFIDTVGQGIKKDIQDLGIGGIKKVEVHNLYLIDASLDSEEIKLISEELLIDKITQRYIINDSFLEENLPNTCLIEVAYNPGVMDPVEESCRKAIADLGFNQVNSIHTAKRYVLTGKITQAAAEVIAEKLLYNKVIQHVIRKIEIESGKTKPAEYKFKLLEVNLLGVDSNQLERLSKEGQLFLNLAEMKQIKNYFSKIGRNPTDCELETLAQTWSEHCIHKTLRGDIEYSQGQNGQKRIIKNLLKQTIMKVSEELNKPWCVSVFKDNSGVIKFDKNYNVCFKVETHNHPSALEPYGGASTGLGGVIRDPLGTGLGAKPIANTDIFCFGPPDYPYEKLPKGALHPKRIMKGVVSGVRDYGNRMGIPTVNGAVLFDERYVGNPLVYCGNVGLIPKDKCFKITNAGDLIVVVGGRTGRDGIHGATFSSAELTHQSQAISGGAVQIGNPITEKKMVDTILKARDKNLYTAITDCGAGGLSSAVGEMGEETGAEVDLEKVPLKYQGLTYSEIWISEAQERMVLSVSPKNINRLMEIFEKENVEATVIGKFTNTKKLILKYNGQKVGDLNMEFLHHGLPRLTRKALWVKPYFEELEIKEPKNLTKYLKNILSSWNVCSKEWIIRQYDHEVQGGSVLKPLVGIKNDGPSDASVVRPILNSKKAIVLSCGINPKYGQIDPYWMAASAIDEALRQIIAVGGSLKQVALLDNFCWGNTDKPDRLGSLVRAAEACYDMAKIYQTPFISGKDSLNNEYSVNGESVSIPPTLLISAIGVIDDVNKIISMDLKKAGNFIYAVGQTYDELGGSHYYELLGETGNNVPQVRAPDAKILMDKLSKAISNGLVKSCHDCSEGGIAVTMAEMAFAGGLGMKVFLGDVPYEVKRKKEKGKSLRNDTILFSESNSRFIVEVDRRKQKAFEKAMAGVPVGLIGCVTDKKQLKVYGLNTKTCLEADIDELKEAWQRPLRW